jgi:hypothetical protein
LLAGQSQKNNISFNNPATLWTKALKQGNRLMAQTPVVIVKGEKFVPFLIIPQTYFKKQNFIIH